MKFNKLCEKLNDFEVYDIKVPYEKFIDENGNNTMSFKTVKLTKAGYEDCTKHGYKFHDGRDHIQ